MLPSHFIILIISLVPFVLSQTSAVQSYCNSLLTCDECISSPIFPCAWCANRAYAELYYPACDTSTYLEQRGCPEGDITIGDLPLSISGSSLAISPTRVIATLRPKFRKSFEIRVSPPPRELYPVDLYMLFDNTRSMEPYLEIVESMSVDLLKFMRNLSITSRVGFGTFVEKETIPFHFNQEGDLAFPGVSHAFENVRSLTSNETLIASSVSNISLGTNDDQPENVLEGILQSLVCTEEIGWRDAFRSFRMIVLMTDSEFHYALDGRLAAIVTPNNMKCSLEEGMYVNSGAQDYPSILQFLNIVLTENVLPVIITDGDYRDLYEELFRIIGIENTIVILTTDLTELRTTVENIYIRASTSARPFLLPENDVIQYELTVLDCGGGMYIEESKSCDRIPRNSSATYKLEVWLNPDLACSMGHAHPHGLDVRFQGFGVVNVTLFSFCECSCSSVSEEDSLQCSSSGDLVCGICECANGFSGPNCECKVNASRTCIEPGSSIACSNKGSCRCGICECNTGTFGDYCHCDDDLCPVYNGEVCGGADKGMCSCDGVCVCTPEYEDGPQGQCSCMKLDNPAAQLGCTDPDNFLKGFCNGFGSCLCGQCVCDVGTNVEDPDYEGQYCEICNVCTKTCALLRPCLSCLLSTGSESCCSGIPGDSLRLSTTNDTRLMLLQRDPAYRMCNLFDENGCIWDYVIPYTLTGNEDEIDIIARRRTCVSPTWWPWLVLAFFLVACTGVIIIIIIRLFVWFVERQEFKLFFDSTSIKKNLPFTNSPLYMPPVTEVDNPTYRKMTSKPVE